MAFTRNAGFTSSFADDAGEFAAGHLTPSRYNLPLAVSGAAVGGIPYCPTATSEKTSADLTFNDSAGVLTLGGSTAGAGLSITNGSVTANSNPLLITQTRTNAGTTYDGAIKVVITDTNSAAGSLAMQILGVNAVTNLFQLDKVGVVTLATGGTVSAPTLTFGTANSGFYRHSSFTNGIAITSAGGDTAMFLSAQVITPSNGGFVWNNQVNSFSSGSVDTGIEKAAAGVVKATNGSGTVAKMRAKFQSSDATDGANAGPFTVITGITVKDGIVTALTGS